jgi:diguanylate cyclase (GGDEF)-like protein
VLDELFEKLRQSGKLPAPTAVGLELLFITDREDSAVDEVAAILQGDPALTRRLLVLANSGSVEGRTEVTTAQAAAMRLGLRSVRASSLGFSLLSANLSGGCAAFDYDGFWSHSLAVAASAQTIAKLRGDVAPIEAFSCGLLQGLGRLALANVHTTAYEGVIERSRGQTSARLAEIERANFGTNHREVAAAMLRHWNLPKPLCAAIAHFDGQAHKDALRDPSTANLARTLQDARDLTRALTADIDASPELCRRLEAKLERIQERLQLDDSGLCSLWDLAAENWRAWGEVLNLRGKTALGVADIRARARKSLAALDDVDEQGPGALKSQITALRILLIGADLARDTRLSQALVGDGHTVTALLDARDSVPKALAWAPHLVVCDWKTAELSGLQVLRSLRKMENGDAIRCLMAVPREKEGHELEAFEAGADECVSRPCDPRILVVRARSMLRFLQLRERIDALELEREVQMGRSAVLARKLQLAAVTDPLTGVYNRGFANQRLERAFEISRNGTTSLSVIALDIDHFRSINQAHGRATGDAVLRATGKLLAGLLRKGDALCRVGVGEFLAICPGAALAGGVEVADRLRDAVRQHAVRVGGFDRAVTISVGVAQLEDSHADVDALWRCVDRRVEAAQAAGGDQVVAHEPPTLLRSTG